MVTVNLMFDDIDDLNAWFDHVCTRCAMCNRDTGRTDPCEACLANKLYKKIKAELGKEEED